jgi:adenosylcobyric acid synthase
VRALMVQGASSWAGKSLLVTALARLIARRGVTVAPFKGQNMSNNARVVHGGEIGVAQYLQALAAGVEPEVRMNPVLVKPEGDNRSQVVVLGKPNPELSRTPWRMRAPRLWPAIESSLRSLGSEYELLLIEGAGSPAEINLRSTDLANMRVARLARASVLLVADIERGGAFAHLYGTWALLEPEERALLRGFVLNKFRGDPALLAPGPERLEELTGIPVVGVVPRVEHGLPDEDGAAPPPRTGTPRAEVVVVRYPTASNLDEFKQLEQVANLVWAGTPRELEGADLVVLPGSKHVVGDLVWLRRTGLDAALAARARAGERVLGICGGLQLLGQTIEDPARVDGDGHGLGLLPLTTVFAREKRTRHTSSRFAELDSPWSELSGRDVAGYEIRHGATHATGPVAEALPDGLGFAAGPVLGVYLHGLFEQPELVAALLGASPVRSLEAELDRLADEVEPHLDLDELLTFAGVG